jgi:NitT/TauT family transport system permease protein
LIAEPPIRTSLDPTAGDPLLAGGPGVRRLGRLLADPRDRPWFSDRAYLLPPPLAVAETGWEIRESILRSSWTTLYSAILGYGLSIVFGMGFAILMSQSKALERSFYPWAVILQVTPVIAIAPVIILWFGFGQTSILIISMLIAFFPILNNTHLGLVSTDRNQVELFQLHDASWFQQFFHLRLPGAIPNIIAGLRISAGLAVIGAILGEFVIGTPGPTVGIGVRVLTAQATLRTTELFAYVIAASLLGLFFFAFVSYLGYRLMKDWHESARTSVVE